MTDACHQAITIDGPSGVGKGTIAGILAQRLNWHWLDSGLLYRAFALHAQNNPEQDTQALIDSMKLHQTTDDVFLNDVCVTHLIRQEQTGALASKLAAKPEVRQALLGWQRHLLDTESVVADGRDMGTVVFPNAVLKIFLTASTKVRVMRRIAQMKAMGAEADYDSIHDSMQQRDEQDRARKNSPLVPDKAAIIINTDELSIEQIVDKIASLLKDKGIFIE